MLHGSINHVSITVSDLDRAMEFMAPFLELLGYSVGAVVRDESADTRLTVNINASNGVAFNVWEAKPPFKAHGFEVYEPGLHHVAFNVDSHDRFDRLCDQVKKLGGQILSGPAEFPYAEDGLGYYAFYFLGPDQLKFECVHMPGLEQMYRGKAVDDRPAVENPTPADVQFLEERLYEFNGAATGILDGRSLGVFLRDAADEMIAGAAGHTWGETCVLNQVWVAEPLRGQGLGRGLMAEAEAEAVRRGCRQLVLTTHSFQAPGFYRKLGFREISDLPDYPRGHSHLVLRKLLSPGTAQPCVD